MIPLSDDPGPRRRFPIVNVLLVAVNVLVFLYEISLSSAGQNRLFLSAAVIPYEYTHGQDLPPGPPLGILYTTIFTSMFMHGGWLHIGSNMLYLWVFGDNVEDRMGRPGYLIFYVVCGIVASVTHIAFNLNSQLPSIGASGAIAGVLAGYLLMFGRARIRTLLFIGPFITITRVPAVLLIGFWFLTQLLSGVASVGDTAQTSGVAVWAHVGGFIAGLFLTPVFRSQSRKPSRVYS
ncbi:MAG: rhomboid family intramembrane serine protease [Chloroflexi bacterium]|nr:rhomboid family intramembrane serine protease [Chloroflexota bacterium]